MLIADREKRKGDYILRNLNSCAFISTRRPRKRTPSACKRNRCSMAESPRNLISPPEPSTRCQGNPNDPRSTRATCRASPGTPAARATAPYVETLPRGIFLIARRIRTSGAAAGEELNLSRSSLPERLDRFFFAVIDLKHGKQLRELQQVADSLGQSRQLHGSPRILRGCVQCHECT